MPRNLIICFDGTNNQFGSDNTSVVRLIQVLDRDPAKQRLYYDPGVGTLPEPGLWTPLQKKLSKWFGLAFGAGLTWKVQEAYTYLMDIWAPGDRVFLFGFSRGAYEARVLAGCLHALGLLPRANYNMVPYVMRLFKSVQQESNPDVKQGSNPEKLTGKPKRWEELCDQFRWTFARPMPGGDDDRRFRVHFLGIWDTVSSVGWVWDPAKFPFTTYNPSISVIRHAVSVDERRCFFRQNLVHHVNGQDLKQYWFPGVHSDVGGGYPEKYSENPDTYSGLWRMPFGWILNEAKNAGLLVDKQRLQTVLLKTPPSKHPWKDPQHESLKGVWWWLAEFFPKLVWRSDWKCRVPKIGRGRYRHMLDGALIHRSTLLRIRDKIDYAPPNFSPGFLEKVRGLHIIPETLPYKK